MQTPHAVMCYTFSIRSVYDTNNPCTAFNIIVSNEYKTTVASQLFVYDLQIISNGMCAQSQG